LSPRAAHDLNLRRPAIPTGEDASGTQIAAKMVDWQLGTPNYRRALPPMNALDPLGWAVILLAFGCGLLVLEIFIPSGGIIGFLAALTLIASMVMAFRRDLTTGLSFTAITLFAVPAVVGLAFKY